MIFKSVEEKERYIQDILLNYWINKEAVERAIKNDTIISLLYMSKRKKWFDFINEPWKLNPKTLRIDIG
jgi:hypothetical protein